jgi:hypothetical protein
MSVIFRLCWWNFQVFAEEMSCLCTLVGIQVNSNSQTKASRPQFHHVRTRVESQQGPKSAVCGAKISCVSFAFERRSSGGAIPTDNHSARNNAVSYGLVSTLLVLMLVFHPAPMFN